MLVDASGNRNSPVAINSELLVSGMLADSRRHMGEILRDLLAAAPDWPLRPIGALDALFTRTSKTLPDASRRIAEEIEADIRETGLSIADEFPLRLADLIDGSSGRSLDGFIRLVGVRAGLLYPQQKNPQKRLNPMDRTLEVIVASTFNYQGDPLSTASFLIGYLNVGRLSLVGASRTRGCSPTSAW